MQQLLLSCDKRVLFFLENQISHSGPILDHLTAPMGGQLTGDKSLEHTIQVWTQVEVQPGVVLVVQLVWHWQHLERRLMGVL